MENTTPSIIDATLNKVIGEILKECSKYILSTKDYNVHTAIFQSSSGAEFKIKLLPTSTNANFKLLLEYASCYGQNLNLTSLRRHNWTDCDDTNSWPADKHGDWARMVFMRTHNKLYPYHKAVNDCNMRRFMNELEHVIDLGLKSCMRNDSWTNDAMAIKAKREQAIVNMKDLLVFESVPAIVTDTFKSVFGDVDINSVVVIKDCESTNHTVANELYDSYAIAHREVRVYSIGGKPEDYEEHYGSKYDILRFNYDLRYDLDSSTFEQVKNSCTIRLQNISIELSDTLFIRQDMPYRDQYGDGETNCVNKMTKQFKEFHKLLAMQQMLKTAN